MIHCLIQAARMQRVADHAHVPGKREGALLAAASYRAEAEVLALHIAGRSARVRRALDGDHPDP